MCLDYKLYIARNKHIYTSDRATYFEMLQRVLQLNGPLGIRKGINPKEFVDELQADENRYKRTYGTEDTEGLFYGTLREGQVARLARTLRALWSRSL